MTRSRCPAGDAGSLAPAVPVLALILLLLGGLVIDASRLLNARGRAIAYAEEAARAGASAIVAGQSGLQLDESAVRARVEGYCAAIQADTAQQGGVRECVFRPPLRRAADDDPRQLVVVVFVRLEIPATLLGIVGVQTLGASGEGRARPFEGVDDTDLENEIPDVDVQVPLDPPEPPPGGQVPIFPEPPPVILPPVDPPPVVPPVDPTPVVPPVDPPPVGPPVDPPPVDPPVAPAP